MSIFYLTDFRGSVKTIIATSFEKAINGAKWTADDVVDYYETKIDYFPLDRTDEPGYLRAESAWCGAV